MTLSKNILKNSRKKSGAIKKVKLDEENYYNEELEKQIWEKIKKAQEQSILERFESIVEEKEMKNEVEEVEDKVEEDID